MADEIIIRCGPGGERPANRHARWRERIAKFAERQRTERQWISLSEIADWCARSVTGASAAAEEQARTLAYQRLDQSARNGEFDRDIIRGGRAVRVSELRYIDPEVSRSRLGREQLTHVYESINISLAQFCWLPREVAWQWLVAHGYPWPAHFDPDARLEPPRKNGTADNAAAPPSGGKPGRRSGRIPKPVWGGAKAEAMRWLDDNGHPQPGDGGQAQLERHIADWLAQRGEHPVESTIRVHVTGWIDEFRAALA
jgi:hypothetical protein